MELFDGAERYADRIRLPKRNVLRAWLNRLGLALGANRTLARTHFNVHALGDAGKNRRHL
eukprot:7170758-Alexandrium_andersonii.AAC.1